MVHMCLQGAQGQAGVVPAAFHCWTDARIGDSRSAHSVTVEPSPCRGCDPLCREPASGALYSADLPFLHPYSHAWACSMGHSPS